MIVNQGIFSVFLLLQALKRMWILWIWRRTWLLCRSAVGGPGCDNTSPMIIIESGTPLVSAGFSHWRHAVWHFKISQLTALLYMVIVMIIIVMIVMIIIIRLMGAFISLFSLEHCMQGWKVWSLLPVGAILNVQIYICDAEVHLSFGDNMTENLAAFESTDE